MSFLSASIIFTAFKISSFVAFLVTENKIFISGFVLRLSIMSRVSSSTTTILSCSSNIDEKLFAEFNKGNKFRLIKGYTYELLT